MSWEWRYVLLTIACFVFAPELGRLVDYVTHHPSDGAFDILPLLMLLALAPVVIRRRRRLKNRAVALVLWLYVSAFIYAGFLATAHNGIFGAMYTGALFCFPALFGLWLMTQDDTAEIAHARVVKWLLAFGGIAGAYGVIQYVVAPPWDTAWMQAVGADSFGTPERFGIRVFGVLNSPGTFALFLGAAIILSLPYVRVRNFATILALLFMILGLLLSLVRAAWLAVAVGVIIYLALSPKRSQAILGMFTVMSVCLVGMVSLALLFPDANVGDKVTSRLATLGDTQDDGSAKERRANGNEALERALANPAGGGLGITGGGSRLSTRDTAAFSGSPPHVIDNGFVSRVFEMGLPGFAGFFFGTCASIVLIFNRYRRYRSLRNYSGMIIAASCVSTQLAILALNSAGDIQQGVIALIFFTALALPMMRSESPSTASPSIVKVSLPARFIDQPAG